MARLNRHQGAARNNGSRQGMIEIANELYLDQQEVLSTLAISKGTWLNLRRRHGGPQGGQLRLGKRLYMRQSVLREWALYCEESTDITHTPRASAPAEPITAAPATPAPAPAPARLRGVPVAQKQRPSLSPFAGVGEVVDLGPR